MKIFQLMQASGLYIMLALDWYGSYNARINLRRYACMSKELKGRAKGGKALAEKMTPEQRIERAKKGSTARWGEKPFRATHRGNFKTEFGMDVDCYVLNDENKTAVISQRGLAVALGYSIPTGAQIMRLVDSKNLAPYVGGEIRQKLAEPIIFLRQELVSNPQSKSKLHGFDVTLLIDICKAIVNAIKE